MTKQIGYLSAMLLFTCLLSCTQEKKESDHQDPENFTYHEVIPADFPSVDINGFNFPEDSTTINRWIHTSEQDSIYLHGWGIWTGLTSLTDQKIKGDTTPLTQSMRLDLS